MNTEKGQVAITIEGDSYLARPTHEAMAQVEAHTGKGILGIANDIFLQKSGFEEICATVFYCIQAETKDVPWSYKEFRDIVYETGVLKFYTAAARLLTIMTTGETIAEQKDPNG